MPVSKKNRGTGEPGQESHRLINPAQAHPIQIAPHNVIIFQDSSYRRLFQFFDILVWFHRQKSEYLEKEITSSICPTELLVNLRSTGQVIFYLFSLLPLKIDQKSKNAEASFIHNWFKTECAERHCGILFVYVSTLSCNFSKLIKNFLSYFDEF